MSASLLSIWNSAARLGIDKPTMAEVSLLILLGASLLALRAFRENYLKLWVVGWAAFAGSRLAEHALASRIPAPFDQVAVQASFVLAAGLLAGAVLLYARARDLIVPLTVITPVLVGFAGARVLLWPDSLPLRVAVEVGYRIILLTASIVLLRARRGRWEPSSWLLALCLPLLHLSWVPFTDRVPAEAFVAAEIALGLAILLVVFDEARARTKRLAVVQALAGNVVTAQQYGSMVQSAVDELQRLTKVRASWFRLLEGGRLVATHAVGVSQDFLRDAGFAEVTEDLSKILEKAEPKVATSDGATPETVECLNAEKIHQLVMLPVVGKKAPIGLLLLGNSSSRRWTTEELEFLQTCARQLAVAVENFRLLEQVLRSQRQWMNTFDSIHDIILAHDADFRIVKANQVLLGNLGKAPADVIGSTCEATLPHSFGQWTGCPYCALGADEEFTEGADPCFGGFSVVSTSSYSEQGNPQQGIIHVVRDITERRSAEEKYRLLFEQVQEGVYVATPAGRIIDCNDAFVHMLGYATREELLVLNLDSEICVDPKQRENFRREIETHNYVRNFEVTLRRKDGTILLAVESSFAKRDITGDIERYQGFVLDMTEKRRAEDEMRRRNRELNALNAMAVVAAQSFDLDEILNLTLRQVVTLFGGESGTVYLSDSDNTTYRRRAAWGPRSRDGVRAAEMSFPDGFGDLVMRSRAEVVTAEYMPHLPPMVAEFLRSDEDRSWIWVLFWGKDAPVGIMGLCSNLGYEYSSNDENLLVAISRQLATTIEKVRLYEETCRAYEDLRKTQEQLLQSEKMSAVGQLIAGVAHELNNPLTAILGYAELLESEGLNSRAQDYVSKLFKQAQRTHRVVQNLLSFARQRKPQREEVDIRRVLDETLALRDYDLKTNNIRVELEAPSEPAVVVADPHQIEQVFLNIINNAVDAILETGRTGKVRMRVYRQNGHVCTKFSDDGPGLKDPKRIFDPFYTTKSVGKGTGLGLSICYGIVKEHGGDITANNNPEGGAVIEVRLPAAATATLEPEAPRTISRQHGGAVSGRVLLVEEEESVLEFERDVLAGAGADVVTARTREDVMTRLLSEHFDAVIMNGKMPGEWSAKESYTWLKTNCSGMEGHVLFTFASGVDPSDARNFLQGNNVPYLVKPCEVAELIAQTRKLLQKAQAAGAGAD
ncbi:MAG TPA: ATP-binding protein [Candidatus Sulfotelmatobacter sp.]|jgi:two-component system NtrC family sensor kinase|nr:ATP-binding protein [Candidatus Sulfotelmatobacter sp.]